MITYHKEGTTFEIKSKRILSRWIGEVVAAETNGEKRVGDISVILCSDEYLLSVNSTVFKSRLLYRYNHF